MFVYEMYPKLADYLIPMRHQNVCYRSHLHACLETHICLDGEVTVTIAGTPHNIGPHQAVMIPPHTVHSYRTENSSRSRTILISTTLIPDLANLLQEFQPSRYSFTLNDILVQQLLDFYDSDQNYFAGKSLIYGLCDAFLSNNPLTKQAQASEELSMQLLNYLQNHFREPVTLKDLTDCTNYSYHYVSKQLKKHFGLTFTQLLAEYRITFARQLLEQHRCNISEVAMRSGFGSIRSFNRVFSQVTGMTPKQYQQNPVPLTDAFPINIAAEVLS